MKNRRTGNRIKDMQCSVWKRGGKQTGRRVLFGSKGALRCQGKKKAGIEEGSEERVRAVHIGREWKWNSGTGGKSRSNQCKDKLEENRERRAQQCLDLKSSGHLGWGSFHCRFRPELSMFGVWEPTKQFGWFTSPIILQKQQDVTNLLAVLLQALALSRSMSACRLCCNAVLCVATRSS